MIQSASISLNGIPTRLKESPAVGPPPSRPTTYSFPLTPPLQIFRLRLSIRLDLAVRPVDDMVGEYVQKWLCHLELTWPHLDYYT